MVRITLTLLLLLSPHKLFAHPNFSDPKDIRKLLFAATQDYCAKRKLKMRLSDGRLYRFEFLCNSSFNTEGIPGALSTPFLFKEIFACKPSNPHCPQQHPLPPKRNSYHQFKELLYFYRHTFNTLRFNEYRFRKLIRTYFPNLNIDWDSSASSSSSLSSSSPQIVPDVETDSVSWHHSDSVPDINDHQGHGCWESEGTGSSDSSGTSDTDSCTKEKRAEDKLIDSLKDYDDYLLGVLKIMSQSDAGQAYVRFLDLRNLLNGQGEQLIQKIGLPTVISPTTSVQYYTLKVAIAPPVLFSLTDLGRS